MKYKRGSSLQYFPQQNRERLHDYSFIISLSSSPKAICLIFIIWTTHSASRSYYLLAGFRSHRLYHVAQSSIKLLTTLLSLTSKFKSNDVTLYISILLLVSRSDYHNLRWQQNKESIITNTLFIRKQSSYGFSSQDIGG